MSTTARILLLIVSAASFFSTSAAHAQGEKTITLKNGETRQLAQVVFPIHPDAIQPKWPKTKDPRPWCVYAVCLPLERARVVELLGPSAVHYRVYDGGHGALFIGNTQVSEIVKVERPAINAAPGLLKETPVVGLKTGTAASDPAIYLGACWPQMSQLPEMPLTREKLMNLLAMFVRTDTVHILYRTC
ncbi:MAG: hypothetical protein H0W47_11765 [Polaromonas sp.]|uniref:hypothetical protein n=1 Tax=Polaromonas sp. TaxID=1869339 RepID=UPI001812A338|nr:hypothetical protein [Polaromonas sp.]MBA3594459.1 hypothetical protein [Polaromonas sp.]